MGGHQWLLPLVGKSLSVDIVRIPQFRISEKDAECEPLNDEKIVNESLDQNPKSWGGRGYLMDDLAKVEFGRLRWT